jgi:riboflavin biosynthesis pyrimidine reductase
MMTSLDGKIMGKYISLPESGPAGRAFYDIAFGDEPYYRHQGWLSGRITTDDNFTNYEKPDLEPKAPLVPAGDYVAAPDAGMFYVSVDPSGKLGWNSSELTYQTTHAHVIEVLTGKASNEYKAFLRGLGISYIIAGDASLDLASALSKLRDLFGIETLMLGGGGVLNWSFIQAGMCDEVSIVIAPAADGDSDTPSLFETRGRTPDTPQGFTLEAAEALDGDVVWLRYALKK